MTANLCMVADMMPMRVSKANKTNHNFDYVASTTMVGNSYLHSNASVVTIWQLLLMLVCCTDSAEAYDTYVYILSSTH